MDNSEVLIDEKVSSKLQYAIYKANEAYKKALEKHPQTLITYVLHYSYPKNGREISQSLLENIYVFRSKLKSIKPLPPKEKYYLKIVKRTERHKLFVDMSIYSSFLNSIRGIIFTVKDSIFYNKIINDYKRAISGNNKDWNIEALDESQALNISKEVVYSFDKTQKLISELLKDKDFDYVYNGILQHSDEKYRDRYIKDSEQNIAIYIIFKCAILANIIRDILLSNTEIFDYIIKNNKKYILSK